MRMKVDYETNSIKFFAVTPVDGFTFGRLLGKFDKYSKRLGDVTYQFTPEGIVLEISLDVLSRCLLDFS